MALAATVVFYSGNGDTAATKEALHNFLCQELGDEKVVSIASSESPQAVHKALDDRDCTCIIDREIPRERLSESASPLGALCGGPPTDDEKDRIIADLRLQNEHIHKKMSSTMESINAFHKQQQQLFKEFQTLRERYDATKANLQHVLWNHIATHRGVADSFPACNENSNETPDSVGKYVFGGRIGDGQFAVVKQCTDRESGNSNLAIKIVRKKAITSVASLLRLHNEIDVLSNVLQNHDIIALKDVIHTPENMYLVTDLGGPDMFEFFASHPEGVSERTARLIMREICNAASYCHQKRVCHRDLKPENVLVSETFNAEGLLMFVKVKICDFGLCQIVDTSHGPLTDFCGTPGFFAPEMIVKGEYNGFLADSWSVGALLLEAVIGQDAFDRTWMSAYAYENVCKPRDFAKAIDRAVNKVDKMGGVSEELRDFLLLSLEPDDGVRSTVKELLERPWMIGYDGSDNHFAAAQRGSLSSVDGVPSGSSSRACEKSPRGFSSVDSKADGRYRDLKVSTRLAAMKTQFGLPQIDASPSIAHAKRIMDKGNALVRGGAKFEASRPQLLSIPRPSNSFGRASGQPLSPPTPNRFSRREGGQNNFVPVPDGTPPSTTVRGPRASALDKDRSPMSPTSPTPSRFSRREGRANAGNNASPGCSPHCSPKGHGRRELRTTSRDVSPSPTLGR